VDVHDATTLDIDDAVAMIERRRLEYQTYQPTFWRKAADSAPSTPACPSRPIGGPNRWDEHPG